MVREGWTVNNHIIPSPVPRVITRELHRARDFADQVVNIQYSTETAEIAAGAHSHDAKARRSHGTRTRGIFAPS